MNAGDGSCPHCGAAVRLVFDSALPGSPMRMLSRGTHHGHLGGVTAAFLETGEAVRVTLDLAGPLEVRLDHGAVCKKRPPPAPLPPGDRGKCRGCSEVIYWIRSAANDKPTPLNPEGFTGAVLTKSEARELRGSSLLVRGYDANGEVCAVRLDGGQMMLGEAVRERCTVWVTHWATCRRRKAFRRIYDRKAPR